MAKKNRDNDGGFGIILLLIGIAILIIATPILLLFGFYYYDEKSKKYDYLKGNLSDFWFTQHEQNTFVKLYNILTEADNKIHQANQHGDKQGISRNKDGRFSLRSNLGKELRSLIEQNEQILRETKGEYSNLCRLPYRRWLVFSEAIIRTKACLLGFWSWLVGGIILILIYANSFIKGIMLFIKLPLLIFSGKLQDNDWKILLGTTAIALIGYYIGTKIYKNIPDNFSPEPPLATAENYNKY